MDVTESTRLILLFIFEKWGEGSIHHELVIVSHGETPSYGENKRRTKKTWTHQGNTFEGQWCSDWYCKSQGGKKACRLVHTS